jgi:peptidylprolyl isomerase
MCIDPTKRYSAEIVTSLGALTVALDAAAAPKTVNNFVFLARYHYYDGVIFHRIIRGFMCQGGDPTGTGRGGPGYRFDDELPQPGRYEIGSLAMANAGPNTNGSQFFIVSGQSGVRLPPQYSLFGKVV